MSRNTALTLTLHVVLTLAGKQANSDSGTAVGILPTSSANIISEKQRKAKFLVSGVTTTTTLSTFTLCYTTTGTLSTPCKRKKRELPSENEIEDCLNQKNSKEETIQDSHDIDRYTSIEFESLTLSIVYQFFGFRSRGREKGAIPVLLAHNYLLLHLHLIHGNYYTHVRLSICSDIYVILLRGLECTPSGFTYAGCG